MTSLKIAEIFGPTIQGEGALIGKPTVFIRAGGCDYRCSWCDSLHAVDSQYRHSWILMSLEDIWQRVTDLSNNKPLTITLSGGNPAIQNFGPLIDHGHHYGYSFAMETQGSIAQEWFQNLDHLILSPKPPSSGENINWGNFEQCLKAGNSDKIILKMVILDEEDYLWAKNVSLEYPNFSVYLQPVNHTPPSHIDDLNIDMAGIINRMDWLVNRALSDQWFDAHILPQLHVLIWGNKTGV